MKRGEVWWAELPPPVGDRPVIILTRDAVLESIGGVVVALVTRTVRQLPTEVVPDADKDCLRHVSRTSTTYSLFRANV